MVSQEQVIPSGIITLLSDFGLSDAYAGVMKGVILSLLPTATLVDLTHDVPPQDVVAGAFLLETAWRYFPAGTVHLAVVDPGVGSGRRRLALRSQGHYFVGPDNGLLCAALSDESRGRRLHGQPYEPHRIVLPGGVEAVSIENPALMRSQLSATFEGRDVFAPAAAHLASGGSLYDLGPRLTDVHTLPAFRSPQNDGRLEGLILHRDHFGNLITDIRATDLPADAAFTVAGRVLRLARTYADSREPSAIISSSGLVEIAMPDGHASSVLGVGPGDRVIAQPA